MTSSCGIGERSDRNLLDAGQVGFSRARTHDNEPAIYRRNTLSFRCVPGVESASLPIFFARFGNAPTKRVATAFLRSPAIGGGVKLGQQPRPRLFDTLSSVSYAYFLNFKSRTKPDSLRDVRRTRKKGTLY